jgi:hypothetical protein
VSRKPKNSAAGLQITGDFVAALTESFAQHGPAALEELRASNPAAYCRVVADLVPRQTETPTKSPFDDMDAEQLREYLGQDDASLIETMAADLPRYEYLLKQARKQAKKQAKAQEQVDPNPHNVQARKWASVRVPWRCAR